MITAYLNLKRREERTRLSCLKYGACLQKVVLSVLGSRSLTWVWLKSSGTRSREMRSINVHHWIKIWSDRNLKTGRFDSLSVRWNYKTLVAALIHIFWPKSSCSSLGLRNDCDTPNKSWPGVSSEWLKITRKDKNLKQTFRLLEEVVRETKAQSVSFLRVR